MKNKFLKSPLFYNKNVKIGRKYFFLIKHGMIKVSDLLSLICLAGVSLWLSVSSLRCHGVVCGL